MTASKPLSSAVVAVYTSTWCQKKGVSRGCFVCVFLRRKRSFVLLFANMPSKEKSVFSHCFACVVSKKEELRSRFCQLGIERKERFRTLLCVRVFEKESYTLLFVNMASKRKKRSVSRHCPACVFLRRKKSFVLFVCFVV